MNRWMVGPFHEEEPGNHKWLSFDRFVSGNSTPREISATYSLRPFHSTLLRLPVNPHLSFLEAIGLNTLEFGESSLSKHDCLHATNNRDKVETYRQDQFRLGIKEHMDIYITNLDYYILTSEFLPKRFYASDKTELIRRILDRAKQLLIGLIVLDRLFH